MPRRPHFYRAVIFEAPHADYVLQGIKHMNVRAKHFTTVIGKDLLMVQDKKALGIIRLTKAIPVTSVKQFRRLYPVHKVTKEERKKWWDTVPTKRHPWYGYYIE